MTPIDQKPGAKQVSWMSANIGTAPTPTLQLCVASLPLMADPAEGGLCPLLPAQASLVSPGRGSPVRGHSTVSLGAQALQGLAADMGCVTRETADGAGPRDQSGVKLVPLWSS